MVERTPIENLSMGLVTKYRPHQIPVGAAQTADNVRFDPRCVRPMMGYKRISKGLKGEPAVLLDGRSQYFRVYLHENSTAWSLSMASAFTLEVFFRLDGLASPQVLVSKGVGESSVSPGIAGPSNEFDWWIRVYDNSGVMTLIFECIGGATVKSISLTQDEDGNPIFPGVPYQLALVNDGAGSLTLYLKTIAGSAFESDTESVAAFTIDETATGDVYFGAIPSTNATGGLPPERAHGFWNGVIQEVRLYNAAVSEANLLARDDAQVASSIANMVCLYRLTGGVDSWADEKLTFEDAVIQPIGGSWVAGLVGDYALRLDGHSSGFSVRDTYLLRDQETNEDDEFEPFLKWGLCVTVKPGELAAGKYIWHWVHMADDVDYTLNGVPAAGTWDGDVTTPLNNMRGMIDAAAVGTNRWQAALKIEADPANANEYQFRFVVLFYNWSDVGTPVTGFSIASEVARGSGGIVKDATYDLFCYCDATPNAGLLRMFVNGTEVGSGAVNFTALKTFKMYKTDDEPEGSSAKYWMEVGRGVLQSRKALAFPGDPNDVDVRLDWASFWRGTIDQFGFVASPASPAYLAKYLANNEITRRAARSLNAQVLMLLPFEEGSGDLLEDWGLQGIGASFRDDADHVRAESLLTTLTKARATGVFSHTYRNPTEVRKGIVTIGGSVYEFSGAGGLPTSMTTLTRLADGLRNDDDNNVSAVKYMDGLILCTGSGRNYHLWKDQLYSLHIDPPSAPISFGLTDQRADEAKLEEGVYRYVFTYYSQNTGKRSSIGAFVEVRIRLGKANIAFGSGVETNQVQPKTGKSLVKAPWDLSAKNCHIHTTSWIGLADAGPFSGGEPDYWETIPGSSGAGTNAATKKKVKFTHNKQKHSSIDDIEEVTAIEAQTLVHKKAGKVECRVYPDDTIELRGKFVGSDAQLYINDHADSNVVEAGGGKIGFTGVSGVDGAVFTGDGSTSGPALPVSSDPQVTHLEIWRTHRDGTDFRRVAKLANGTLTYIDNTPDSELVGQTLEISTGFPPGCKYVTLMGKRALFFGNDEHPQRIWFSKIGELWNVPPQNTIDLTEGDTLAITAGAVTENLVLIFKNDTTFVLTPPTNSALPFGIEARLFDVGAVSPFGLVNVENQVFYATEKGFYQFNGTVPQYVGKAVGDLWYDVAPENWKTVVAARHREGNLVIWFAPSGNTSVGGLVVNDQAFVLDVDVGAVEDMVVGWSRMTGAYVSAAHWLPDKDDVNRLYLIDPLGYIYVMGEYGAYGPDTTAFTTETTAAATSASADQVKLLQLNQANYPDGYKGLPVTVVDADTGVRATRLCISDDLASPNSTLTVDSAYPFTPTAGDVVILGSIEADWKSGEISPAPADVVHLERMFLEWKEQTTAANVDVLWQAIEGQDSDEAASSIQLANTRKTHWEYMKGRGRRFWFQVRARGTNRPFELTAAVAEWEPSSHGKKGR